MNNPVWLKVVCIASIVLGSLGLVMSAGSAVMVLNAERTQAATLKWMEAIQGPGIPPQLKDLQRELMQQASAIQRDWMVINLTLLAVACVVASLLLAGGIMELKQKPTGRKLLLTALVLAAVFELVRVGPTATMQWQMSKLMSPYTQRLIDAVTPPSVKMPPAQKRAMQTVIRSSMVAGVLMGVVAALGMTLVKLAFYVWGIFVLRRAPVGRNKR